MLVDTGTRTSQLQEYPADSSVRRSSNSGDGNSSRSSVEMKLHLIFASTFPFSPSPSLALDCSCDAAVFGRKILLLFRASAKLIACTERHEGSRRRVGEKQNRRTAVRSSATHAQIDAGTQSRTTVTMRPCLPPLLSSPRLTLQETGTSDAREEARL